MMFKSLSLYFLLSTKILLSFGATLVKPIPDNLENFSSDELNVNNRPIIGILTQEIAPNDENFSFGFDNELNRTYVAASYIKHIEGSGARVIPIWIGKGQDYYEDILSKVNGVLFPGGAVYFNRSSGYSDAGMTIFKIAKKLNDKGTYFPLWGTCLGFELLSYLSANGTEHRADCSSGAQALNLEFKPEYKNSRLYGKTSPELINILKTENVTANFHRYCVTEKNLTDYKLNDQWTVLTVNKDWNGFEFISSFEHKKYPFYGVQFHPEKNAYEWVKNRNITHTYNAIVASQYFANFFVNESRKNNNQFLNKKEETESLIYNYIPVFIGKRGSVFEQLYVFPQSNDGMNSNYKDQDDSNDIQSKGCNDNQYTNIILDIEN